MNKVKIVGVVGSPRKEGNTDILVREALRGAEEQPNVVTELIHLSDYRIKLCRGCLYCYMTNECSQEKDQDDDMKKIYPKFRNREIDGMLLGSAVYWGTMTGLMKNFLDRLQPMCTPAFPGMPRTESYIVTKDIVCGALCVSGGKKGGADTAILTILQAMLFYCCIVVPAGPFASGAGGTGVNKGEVRKDEEAMTHAKLLGMEVARVASLIKKGKEV